MLFPVNTVSDLFTLTVWIIFYIIICEIIVIFLPLHCNFSWLSLKLFFFFLQLLFECLGFIAS